MKAIKFPLHYKAIELPAYNMNTIRAMLSLRLAEKTIERIASDILLIRVQAAPCNPSDIAFLQGGYNVVKALPCVPGFEGTGIVVAVGDQLNGEKWLGKRISFFAQTDDNGSWSEYTTISESEAVLMDEKLNTDQAAGFFVNPFTAYGLFEIALKNQSSAIIVNAAGSRVASFLLAFAKRNGIACFGIVRKQQTIDQLDNKGFSDLFLVTDEQLEEKLRTALKSQHSAIFYDAVAGEQSGSIARCMPVNSEVVVYGGLSAKDLSGFSAMQLIFNNLKISGFNLNDWMRVNSDHEKEKAGKILTEMFLSGEIEIPVSIRVKPEEIVKGLRTYLGDMSAGKMLIEF
jgi:NADPH2:quinone reductase